MSKMELNFDWSKVSKNDIVKLINDANTWKDVEYTKSNLEITWGMIDNANEMNLIINLNDDVRQLFTTLSFIPNGSTNIYLHPAVVNGGDVYDKYVLLTIYYDPGNRLFHLIGSINNVAFENFTAAQIQLVYR